ncbi:MAG: ABC transporter ATP-binding protein [Candidatus Hodarchaeota archaeon]
MSTEKDGLLRVENLKKWFPVRTGFFAGLFSKEHIYAYAVDDITFNIRKGEILCLAGESGCGKTTVGRTILRLTEPTDGKVYFNGEDVFSADKERMRKLRQKMQMIFQDPYESLNQRMTVFDIVAEPIKIHKLAKSSDDLQNMVTEALEAAELRPPSLFFDRFPHELSGGQRQRVNIARAMILDPEFVVADEPVSMIDVSVRTGILNLMMDLRDKFGLSYLFITHDLAQARYIADNIAIMYLGKIVGYSPIEKMVKSPLHPYSQALISNIPVPEPELKRDRILITGEPPTPINPPSGCRFHPRCPKFIGDICKNKEPIFKEVEKNHWVACHLYD